MTNQIRKDGDQSGNSLVVGFMVLLFGVGGILLAPTYNHLGQLVWLFLPAGGGYTGLIIYYGGKWFIEKRGKTD